MNTGYLFLYAWAVALFVLAGFIVYLAIRFLQKARKYAKTQEQMIKVVEMNLKEKHNAIASLGPKDLMSYLTTEFAKILEIKATSRVSEIDPQGEEKLYAESVGALISYLGEDTVRAIDYYYGKDYIYRWTMNSYELLSKRGVITEILKNGLHYEDTSKRM